MGVPRINLAETSDFDLGALRVCPARRQVSMAGEYRELEPKVAQVLVALAAASPAVVSRDRLVEQCWDGRIVGDDALNRCILSLRHLAKEYSPAPFAIETVPRVGYSLLAGPAGVSSRHRHPIKTPIAIALLLALVIGSGLSVYFLRYARTQAAPASIAVLPFRNLSAGDSYFAQGISEEILGQLSREPQFRVAGSTSSAELGQNPNVRAAAKELNVDYVVEGSVRRQGSQVRVNADLLRANDGVRLWSDTYDGKLDDILKIQSAIGQAVANGLRRKLVLSPRNIGRPINGEAYALYLNARGLMRSDNPQTGQEAAALLRQAIRLDPHLAAAWASLARALYYDGDTKGEEGLIAILPAAQAAAVHALQLDPNLADAHGALAMLLGSESPEAVAHLRRAAALDPRSGQGLMWLTGAQTDLDQIIATDRLAHDADPLWPIPVRALIDNLALKGDRGAAEAVIRSDFPDDPMGQSFAMARVARLLGNFSEAARRWSIVANSQSTWAVPSKGSLEKTLFALKLSKIPPQPPHFVSTGGNRFIAPPSIIRLPSALEWQQHNRSLAATLVYEDENVIGAKLMLAAGRASELVATYDSSTGLFGIRKGQPLQYRIRDVPIIAIALRQRGRPADADALLRQADAAIKALQAHSTPIWFDEDVAGVWAAEGKSELAIDALERAFRRSWFHVGHTDLPTLREEPAFQSLHRNARFEALLARHAAHFARERAETASALHIQI